MNQIARGLIERGNQVKVLAVSPHGRDPDPAVLPEDYLRATRLEYVPVDTRIRPAAALRNLFSSRSYNMERFHSQAMEQKLAALLRQESFDLIQLEGLYLTPYIPVLRKHSKAPLIYRAHNIEHLIWERLAASCRNPVKKWYLGLLAGRLKKYETRVIREMDGLLAISPVDLALFHGMGYRKPAVVIPVAMPDNPLPDPLPEEKPGSVFHLGSMDWRPNQEGVLWFLEEVWPLVTRRKPGLKLYLAGKRMPRSFYRHASEQVEVVGEVPDAWEFMLKHRLMVVPLLSGSGMRVKIIEGMAAGRVIVSTRTGAEGTGCQHGTHLYLADNPEQMAFWILHAFRVPSEAGEMAGRARRFVAERYSMPAVMDRLLAFYRGFYS
jgi:glycosyltransferase involved in cell wall biosynthesis